MDRYLKLKVALAQYSQVSGMDEFLPKTVRTSSKVQLMLLPGLLN